MHGTTQDRMTTWRKAFYVAGLCLALAFAPIHPLAAQDGAGPNVMPPHAFPYGKSYGKWSAKWWQWQLAIPYSVHPGRSLDGADCAIGQSGKVWFLTGTIVASPDSPIVTVVRESCVVPAGKALFFPILSVECSTVEPEPFRLILEGPSKNVDSCAADFIDGPFLEASDLSVTVDDQPVTGLERFRFQSPVFPFAFDNQGDNIYLLNCGDVDCDNAKGVSDGYWIMLAPLSRGEHSINFAGSYKFPQSNEVVFGQDVTYLIVVE